MDLPLQISFHGLRHSDAIYDLIRERAERLERFHRHLLSCRVSVEVAARHKRHGRQCTVHVILKAPGGEIAVTHEHDEDMNIAVREAFDAARRKLEDFARKQRGDVKRRAA
jgi:ribosomal subunit interface protein